MLWKEYLIAIAITAIAALLLAWLFKQYRMTHGKAGVPGFEQLVEGSGKFVAVREFAQGMKFYQRLFWKWNDFYGNYVPIIFFAKK